MAEIRWCVAGAARLQVIVPTIPLTFHASYLPLPPFSSSPFSYPCPYHYLVCYPAHGHTGVFQNNCLWHKLLALIFAINPFCFSFPVLLFPAHFSQYPFAEKMHALFCRTIIPEIYFLALSFVKIFHFSLWAMAIIYIEGNKPPCKPYRVVSLVLWGERET